MTTIKTRAVIFNQSYNKVMINFGDGFFLLFFPLKKVRLTADLFSACIVQMAIRERQRVQVRRSKVKVKKRVRVILARVPFVFH